MKSKIFLLSILILGVKAVTPEDDSKIAPNKDNKEGKGINGINCL